MAAVGLADDASKTATVDPAHADIELPGARLTWSTLALDPMHLATSSAAPGDGAAAGGA